MMDADGTCILTLRLRLLGLRVGGHLAVSLHSSNEPGVYTVYVARACHDHGNSIINIVIIVIVIIENENADTGAPCVPDVVSIIVVYVARPQTQIFLLN